MSLLHRISSLHVCNVITGWLWASVNKTDAQSLLGAKKKRSHYCLRLTADCQVSSWIHYRDSFRLSRIDSYLFLNFYFFFFPPPGSTGASSPYHYWNIFHFIRLRHAPMWCPRSWRHYTLHNNTQARLRCLSIKIQSGHKARVSGGGERRCDISHLLFGPGTLSI